MVICIKDKNFSGTLIKNSEDEVIIQLKPYNKDTFVRIQNGFYEYLNENQIQKSLR